MIITHKLQPMDLTHKQNTIRVDVVQDDKYSRDVEFTFTENGVAWQIPDGTTAVVRYKKPDGTGGNYDTLPDGSTAYQINGNVLTVALAPQVCTVQGHVQLSVGIIHGSVEINTFSVNIVVHPNPGAEYQSEDYIKLSGAVPNSGWTPNMYLGTDASGNVVAKEGTSGGGSTSGKDVVGIQSVEQTTTSTEDGGTNIVTVTKTDGTSSTFQVKNGSKGSPGQAGTNGKSAYQYAVEGGYTGTEEEFAAKMAEEMPDKLPNPNVLTFTGAVTGSYDGSEPLNVKIPSGGSGGSAEPGYKDATTLFDVTLDDTTGGLKSYEYDVSGIEKTDVIIINILFPASYSGIITIKNQADDTLTIEFPYGSKGMTIGLKIMNGRYMHSCVSSENTAARVDVPLSLFYGQINGASGFERPKAPDTITKLKFTLSAAFVSGTRIRAYRW